MALRRGLSAFACLALLAPLVSGCWSGFAWQSARRQETVTRFSDAWSDGERLVLRFDVALADRDGAVVAHEPRAAQLRLSDLAAVPELAVDAIPVREVPVPPPLGPEDRPVPIFRDAGESDGGHATGAAQAAPLLLVVRQREGAEGGLELFSTTPETARLGWLDADVLYRERLAWWMAPVLPLAAAFDLAILPFQLLTAWPFFVLGD